METKVKITNHAAKMRLRRYLAKQGMKLGTARNARFREELGEFYTIDINHNAVRDTHVDIEGYGRSVGVIEDYEAVED